MTAILPLIFAAVAGLIIGYMVRAQHSPKPKIERREWLLMDDGQLLTVTPVKPQPGGVQLLEDRGVKSGYLLPDGAIYHTIRMDDHQFLHVSRIERLALLTHDQLDEYRSAVLERSVPAFKPGGDSGGFMRSVATIAPILLSVFITFQIFNIIDLLNQTNAATNTLNVLIKNGVPLLPTPAPVVP